MLVGLFECINWVDALVRNVVLNKLTQELATDTVNFDIKDVPEYIDDPGEGTNVNDNFIEDLVRDFDTNDFSVKELMILSRRLNRLRLPRAAVQTPVIKKDLDFCMNFVNQIGDLASITGSARQLQTVLQIKPPTSQIQKPTHASSFQKKAISKDSQSSPNIPKEKIQRL